MCDKQRLKSEYIIKWRLYIIIYFDVEFNYCALNKNRLIYWREKKNKHYMRWMLYHTQLKRISCFWVVGATQKYESKSFLFHWINTNIRRIWNSDGMGSLNCNQTKCLKKNKITIDIDLIDIPTDCFQQSNFNRAHFHILKSILNSFPHFGIVQISRAHRQSSAKKEY